MKKNNYSNSFLIFLLPINNIHKRFIRGEMQKIKSEKSEN